MNARWALSVAPLLLLAAGGDPFSGRTAGEPRACIDAHFSQEVQIFDPHTIIYRETAKRLWRTGPDGPCPDLEPSATLIVEQVGADLCQGDRFRARRQGIAIPGPICRFSGFIPYDKR